MQLGMLITEATHADNIVAITKAALQRGHSVRLFMADDGVHLVKNGGVMALRKLENVEVSLCDYSANKRNLGDSDIPEGVIKGTQYQNSLMHNECDKILVL